MVQNRDIFVVSLLLIGSILFFGLSHVDIYLQDMFFDFETKKWILDSSLQPYKFIFYNGIKNLLIIIAVLFLITFIYSKLKKVFINYHRGLLIVVASSILIPVSVGGLKKISNMPCPKNEIRYCGIYPEIKVWESYPKEFACKDKIQCWPAGHASGGFALMSLFFLFHSKRNKFIALGSALVIGWSMGLYKMIIGDHYFSHTFITMLIAWLLVLILSKVIKE